jgi:predicted rRNA methylase YqxC with S4 and FtsJ domains
MSFENMTDEEFNNKLDLIFVEISFDNNILYDVQIL